ncbi:unnamed protein product [Cuscuta europaea]|uniref:Uncharacterized protein n=1 Tax=Cuscuta europaea TaxID=41803 RepID=A0A9P0ZX01_CUSEU|nr:unnamed protein product [Cuscuta europaea]
MGIAKANTLMNSIVSKTLAIEHDLGDVFSDLRGELDFLPLNGDYPHSCETNISISGALLQADIEHIEDYSLVLVSTDDDHCLEPSSLVSMEDVQCKNMNPT